MHSKTPPSRAHSGPHHPHHSSPAPSSQLSRSHTLLLAFGVTGAVTLLVLILLSLLIFYYKFRSSKTTPLDPPSGTVRLRKFSYRTLKAATGSFSSENKLGQGGFGPVHKGTLRSGQVVAVKSLDSSSLQGEKEFQNEVSVIGGVRSGHIVGLLGYCSQGKKRLLVYEYMSRGSLQEALFHEEQPVHLDWKMRHRIILEVAQSLAFLHFRCEPPIIHGDIKPSNVLLDENFVAKLADFGLARVKSDVVTSEVDGDGFVDLEKARFGKDSERGYHARTRSGKVCVGVGVGGGCGGGVNVQVDEMDNEDHKSTTTTTTTARQRCLEIKPVDQSEGVEAGFSFHNDHSGLSSCPTTPTPTPSTTATTMVGLPGSVAAGGNVNDDETRQRKVRSACPERSGSESGRRRGREWWWGRAEEDCSSGVVKDYTVDWVTCEVKRCQSRSRDWGEARPNSCSKRPRMQGVRESESWSSQYVQKIKTLKRQVRERWKRRRKDEHQQQQKQPLESFSRELSGSLTKSREWWKEEYVEELSNKSRELKGERCKKKSRSRDMWCSFDFSGDLATTRPGQREWWSGDLLHWMHRSRGDSGTIDFSGELNSLSRELRNNNNNNNVSNNFGYSNRERTLSRERWSGELVGSRAMSSTTSMRGTVCYTAPEYGGAGVCSEKSDVYSFGVLMLVIISGRRPLQVVSPREFERASLTSWARNLAHSGGDVLELVDSSLRGAFSREQAMLCIMVALQCIQRIPAARPSMAEVVRIVSGEAQLPPYVPEMFSPSPSQQLNGQAWKHQGEQESPLLVS